jgi:hypothetical protein
MSQIYAEKGRHFSQRVLPVVPMEAVSKLQLPQQQEQSLPRAEWGPVHLHASSPILTVPSSLRTDTHLLYSEPNLRLFPLSKARGGAECEGKWSAQPRPSLLTLCGAGRPQAGSHPGLCSTCHGPGCLAQYALEGESGRAEMCVHWMGGPAWAAKFSLSLQAASLSPSTVESGLDAES